jgi:hypothetical protein
LSPVNAEPPIWPVQVVGLAHEEDPVVQAQPRAGLTAAAGEISLLLLVSRPGVTLGSSLTRKPELVAQIRRIREIGEVRTSPIAGTVGPGGENWLGFLAVARMPQPCPRPLDRLTHSLRAFLEERLRPSRVRLSQGQVDGAWCPGFRDLSVEGRKLAGLGLRLTGGWGLVRGVVAVCPPGPEELAALNACHLVFGSGVNGARLISISELPGLSGTDRDAAARLLGGPDLAPAKM